MKDADILSLFDRYLDCASQISAELREDLGSHDLLRAINSGTIPRRGACRSFGGGEYFIHGTGCRVQCAEIEIDFDFGPSGTLPGVDPWKLYSFAEGHSEAYPWLPSRAEFEQRIQKLIAQGQLRKLGELPSPHLLCRV